MGPDSSERTVYLLALVFVLFVLLYMVGLPSKAGLLVLTVILVLAWRVGVVIHPKQ